MALEVFACASCPITNARRLGPEFGVVEQLFDVPHAVGPLAEAFTGDRIARPIGRAAGHAIVAAALRIPAAASRRTARAASLLLPSRLLLLSLWAIVATQPARALVASLALAPLLALLAALLALAPLLALLAALLTLAALLLLLFALASLLALLFALASLLALLFALASLLALLVTLASLLALLVTLASLLALASLLLLLAALRALLGALIFLLALPSALHCSPRSPAAHAAVRLDLVRPAADRLVRCLAGLARGHPGCSGRCVGHAGMAHVLWPARFRGRPDR